MTFLPRTEHELVRMGDDELIEHVRRARAVGEVEQAVLALRVLVYGHWDRIERRVALKVPREEVEAVTSDVVFSAISSAFDGGSPGEFATWLNTITSRRIADHHRRRAGSPTLVEIGSMRSGEEAGSAIEPADRSQEGLVETEDALARVLGALSEQHARVVERHVLAGVPAREVGEELGVGADNVAQIASRFRRRLREHLSMGEDR
ncbi:RNA polymerase sigma factor (sigma-70 family) [Conexibacter arvalis]|uniref:RNA polymerase sigma factor (Sigma-70 family) n=1 Tax=Conexibacter arvalis TaxID=912552 RepID=A0A840IKD2_9ACTN|nr:RNA polymerase sigma factor (sigma-70 family) [Conexibacter arvalis]